MIDKKELEAQIESLSERVKALSPDSVESSVLLGKIVEGFLHDFPSIAEHENYHGEALGYIDSAYTFFGVLHRTKPIHRPRL
jgi:hypothetical protein